MSDNISDSSPSDSSPSPSGAKAYGRLVPYRPPAFAEKLLVKPRARVKVITIGHRTLTTGHC